MKIFNIKRISTSVFSALCICIICLSCVNTKKTVENAPILNEHEVPVSIEDPHFRLTISWLRL